MSQYTLPPFTLKEVSIKQLAQSPDWSIGQYAIPEQWSKADGTGIKVAILDTGVESTHPDLENKIINMKDFTNSRWGPEDRHDHGTWVAGMIGAENNDLGVVGVAPGADLYIGKVLGDSGGGSSASVANGIHWAIEQDCQIISMSLGSPYSDPQIFEAIKDFVARPNCYVIAAAGNDGNPAGTNSINYPGRYRETIAVGAVDKYGQRTYFSSRGPMLDVMGPGQDMLSTITNKTYGLMSGTSMATPFVCGVIVLALSDGKDFIDYEGLREVIKDVSKDIDDEGHDANTGWGLINPDGILESDDEPTLPDVPDLPDDESSQSFVMGGVTVSFPVNYNGVRGIHIGIEDKD